MSEFNSRKDSLSRNIPSAQTDIYQKHQKSYRDMIRASSQSATSGTGTNAFSGRNQTHIQSVGSIPPAALQIISSLKSEIKTLEDVNLKLIQKQEQHEKEVIKMNQELKTRNDELITRQDVIQKSETIIKKQLLDYQNQKRAAEFALHDSKVAKEQLRALQLSTTNQSVFSRSDHNKELDLHKSTLYEVQNKLEDMRRQHLLKMDQEQDKYQELLHRNTALSDALSTLRLQYQAKEQECLTLTSYTKIQTGQIETLQDEIQQMITKLESIKGVYENEIEVKDQMLTSTKNIAITHLKQMQHSMRQSDVNNHKEIMKLREELRVKQEQLKMKLNKQNQENQMSPTMTQDFTRTLTRNSSLQFKRAPLLSSQKKSQKKFSDDADFNYSIKKEQGDIYAVKKINPLYHDVLVNSPLLSWLKQELLLAWVREKNFKIFVKDYSERRLSRLQIALTDLQNQHGYVRKEVEAWQMRNEEMETRLHNSEHKLWSLKQICIDQQKQLKKYAIDKQHFSTEVRLMRNTAEKMTLECKTDYYNLFQLLREGQNDGESLCDVYRKVIESRMHAQVSDSDRFQLMKQLEAQVDLSKLLKEDIINLENKNQILDKENSELVDVIQNERRDNHRRLSEIFDRIDPQTSIALVDPSIEQIFRLIENKLGQFVEKIKLGETHSQLQPQTLSSFTPQGFYSQELKPNKNTQEFNKPTKFQTQEFQSQGFNDYNQLLEENRLIDLDRKQMRCEYQDLKIKNDQLQNLLNFKEKEFLKLQEETQKTIEVLEQEILQIESQRLIKIENQAPQPQPPPSYIMSSRPILNVNSKYSNPLNTGATSRKNSPYQQNKQLQDWISSSQKEAIYQIQAEGCYEQDQAEGEDSYSENKQYTSLRNMTYKDQNPKIQQVQILTASSHDRLNIYSENQYDASKQGFYGQEFGQIVEKIKEDIFDAVNDLKSKDRIWSLSQELKNQCDLILKKMILQGKAQNCLKEVADCYELVRKLFDILRVIMNRQGEIQQNQSQEQQISHSERNLIKACEITQEVFRKAYEKIKKTGEREWRDVLQQQVCIFEEILNLISSVNELGVSHKVTLRQQEKFDHALADFQYCISKAADSAENFQKVRSQINSIKPSEEKPENSYVRSSIDLVSPPTETNKPTITSGYRSPIYINTNQNSNMSLQQDEAQVLIKLERLMSKPFTYKKY